MAAVSRRTFLQTATTAAAAASVWRARRARAEQAARGSVSVTLPLATFPYGDVQLLDGPMKRQFDENHERFLHLDDDRMLKVFRQVAGMPAPGEDMGGWYDLTGFNLDTSDFQGFIAGHSFGQYVSGLARAYAVTGSEPTRAKVSRLVKGYADTLDDKAIFFKGYRLPAYTYDKLSCGLIDAYEFTRDPIALDVHEKLTRGVTAYLPEKALSRAEQRMRPHKDTSFTWDESYTLPENLFLAYQRSGKPFYRDMAKQFLEDDTYFDPLAGGYNVLPFEHAYSHVNAFSSAMQAYITLGSEKHLRAARNGFEMVDDSELCHWRVGPERGVLRTRYRAARRQPADVARQLRDALWRVRSFQDRAVPSSRRRRRRVTATAWSGSCTTPSSGRGRSRPTAHRSTTPTTGPPDGKSGTETSGRAARARSPNWPRTTTSARTCDPPTAST